MEESNMKPPAGGKCRDCWGFPKGHSGFKVLLDSYLRNAKQQKREFSLTEEEFKNYTSQSCYYCNQLPSKTKSTKARSRWGDYSYNGIDRIDNSIGYTNNNCVTCCYVCNRAKNNMSFTEFMVYINRIKSLGLK